MNLTRALAAMWILFIGVAFFTARLALFIGLIRAKVGIRVVWSGIPGYLERRYALASEGVRAKLKGIYRVHERLKWTLCASLLLGALVLLVAAHWALPMAAR